MLLVRTGTAGAWVMCGVAPVELYFSHGASDVQHNESLHLIGSDEVLVISSG